MCLTHFLTLFVYNVRHFDTENTDKLDCVDNAIPVHAGSISMRIFRWATWVNITIIRFQDSVTCSGQKPVMPPIDYFCRWKCRKPASSSISAITASREIAFGMGFDDHIIFSKRFRTIIGVSPKKYRQLKIWVSVVSTRLLQTAARYYVSGFAPFVSRDIFSL